MKALVLTICGLSVGFLAAEAGLRGCAQVDRGCANRLAHIATPPQGPVFTRWVDHPFRPYSGRPSMELEDTHPGFGAPRTITRNNAYGYRTDEFRERTDPDDLVVLCFGGSTTWGAIAETNETTWPGLLQARLKRRYPQRTVRVHNFGTSAGTSAYSLVGLMTVGVHLNPDLVIVYHAKTDYEPARRADYRSDHSHYFKDLNTAGGWLGLRRALPDWMLRSWLVGFAAAEWDDASDVGTLMYHVTKSGPATVDPAVGIQGMFAHLETMDSVSAGHGARTLFSTFQFYDGNDPTLSAVNTELREFLTREGKNFVDQDRLIPDFDRSINIDDCHFTRKGREMVAQNFFDHIVQYDLLGAN